MPYLLAAFAVVAPVVLVIQSVRGRVQLRQCCAVPPGQDARLTVPSPTPQDG